MQIQRGQYGRIGGRPDRLCHVTSRNHVRCTVRKRSEQPELGRRQLQRLAVSTRLAAAAIDSNAADLVNGAIYVLLARIGARFPTQRDVNSSLQLIN